MLFKNVLYFVTALTLLSCSAPVIQYSHAEDDLADVIKNSIKDNAVKDTADCKIYSLNILKIDTVTTRALDAQLMMKMHERFDFCNTLADLYTSMAKTSDRIRVLNGKMKHKTLPSVASQDINDDTFTARLYKDSANYYNALIDSLNKTKDLNNKLPDTLYKVKTFLKITEKKDNDSVNYSGTKYYYVTKNKKVVDIAVIN